MNILIIDDESLILNSVYNQIKRADLKLDRVDTAGSAKEARRKMEKNYYHIFLCDIVMPEEDGISFAGWVLQRFPDCKFIFLTAHADFEYMKEAISMQSFDYILQPAREGELENVVRRAMQQISIEQKNRKLMDMGTFFFDKEMDILDGNALRYLQGYSHDDSFLRRMIEMKIGRQAEECVFYPFSVENLKKETSWKEEEKSLLRSIYYNIFDELMNPLGAENVIILRHDSLGDFIVLAAFDKGNVCGRDRILNQLENMRTVFIRLMKMESAVCCGDFCSYEQLSTVCRAVFREQENNVRDVSRIYQIGQKTGILVQEELDTRVSSWRTLLARNRLNDFKENIVRYLNYHGKRNDVNREFMMKLHQRISEMLFDYMAAGKLDSADVFDEKLSYYDFMYCWKKVDDMKAAVEYLVDRLNMLTDADTQDVIQRIVRYIRQNVDSDILVSELAEKVGMNPEYLTTIFKKSTGYSLKKFIENEKMGVAKILLVTTGLPVTIISERVGYASYNSFTRSFRQNVGCTPSEYRDNNKKE